MNNTLLSLTDVDLSLDARRILSRVSLSVATGEKVSLVGANGSGKSSLLKVIAGLYRNYQGSAIVDGREVAKTGHRDLARVVSLIPQRMEYLPAFTVGEFLELSAESALPVVDQMVAPLYNRYLPELSGGELQRVVLAAAIAQGAKLLLLDEPTAHLDPRGRLEVEQVVEEYHKQRSISYILVTHDITLATQSTERMIIMKEGRVMWEGATTDPEVSVRLGEAYGRAFVTLRHPTTGAALIVPG
jgi:iron complex transport system ATP-binding protein